MHRRFTAVLGVLVLLAILPVGAHAQDPAAIIDEALARYAESVESIDNYLLESEVSGHQTITFHEKVMVGGFPVFQDVTTAEANQDLDKPFRMFQEIAERATYAGSGEVDGHATHILLVEDFEGLDLGMTDLAGPEGEFQARRMTIHIDKSLFVPRMMMFEGDAMIETESRAITATVLLKDYREVEGMLHPFLTEVKLQGLMGEGGGGISEEQRAEAEEALREMEQQMEGMDPSQREMMARLIEPQLESLREMLGSGTFDFTTRVIKLVPNAERPPDL